jgi:hypothetical protein
VARSLERLTCCFCRSCRLEKELTDAFAEFLAGDADKGRIYNAFRVSITPIESKEPYRIFFLIKVLAKQRVFRLVGPFFGVFS